MTRAQRANSRTRRRWLLLAAGTLLIAAAFVIWLRRDRGEQRSEHDVPLGVEEAVVIRYAGPRLVERPYRRGASINLRVAEEHEAGAVRVYDVRYIVNLPGEFNLTDYLMTADGSPLDDLPSFTVRGLTALSKDIETRIQEIEAVGFHIWHWYYETLVGLGVFWVLWLVALIVFGRRWKTGPRQTAAPELSLAERLRACLAAIAAGDESVARRSELEILLLQSWRARLGLHAVRMAEACRRVQRSDAVGRLYGRVIAWLHQPQPQATAADLLRELQSDGGRGDAERGTP